VKTQGKDEGVRDSGFDGSEEEGEMGEGSETESAREEVREVKEVGEEKKWRRKYEGRAHKSG
jgi:hypothetical protein